MNYKRILAIDPGTTSSGWIIKDVDTMQILDCGIEGNGELLSMLYISDDFDFVIIEMFASYGMPVGKVSFDTVVWIGRFLEAIIYRQTPHRLQTRKDTKKMISSGRATDAVIAQAIRDRYPRTGGGSKPTIGTKKEPGPLYGVKSHIWQALALIEAYEEGAKAYELC